MACFYKTNTDTLPMQGNDHETNSSSTHTDNLNAIKSLTEKLTKAQRLGNLQIEADLCARLFKLHASLGQYALAVQFGHSCRQIAQDLQQPANLLKAVTQLIKLFIK